MTVLITEHLTDLLAGRIRDRDLGAREPDRSGLGGDVPLDLASRRLRAQKRAENKEKRGEKKSLAHGSLDG
jgi:hypothetical protein